MQPYQSLSTPRLSLRPLADQDLHAIAALRASEVVCRYIGRPLLQHTGEAAAFIEMITNGYAAGTAFYWAICIKETQELIGTICLWNFSAANTVADIGYEMLPQHHGNGYMQEALVALCLYGFTSLKLKAIEASTHKDNLPSRKLLERNGFILSYGRADPDAESNLIYIARGR